MIKKRAIGLGLLLAILLTLSEPTVTTASAASFSDIKSSDWFYETVEAAASANLMNGYPDGTFRPAGAVTRAEFVKMLVSAFGYETAGGYYFADTLTGNRGETPWFYESVSTALKQNLLYREEYPANFSPNTPITRKETAVLCTRALGLTMSPFSTPYADIDDLRISALYNEGILQGEFDGNGNRVFRPNGAITRAEACTVAMRLAQYRKDAVTFKVNAFQKNLNGTVSVNSAPQTKEAFYYTLLSALKESKSSLTFEYKGTSFSSQLMNDIQSNVFAAFRELSSSRPEYASLLGLSFTKSGDSTRTTVTIAFETSEGISLSIEDILSNNKKAKQKAMKILPEIIDERMNEMDRATAIHDYLILNTQYAEEPTEVDFTGYGALIGGKAVCQGYSAAFNLLCALAGVKSQSAENSEHMWNVVLSGGTSHFFDVTWDDPIPDQKGRVLYNYCGISEETLLTSRAWDKSNYSTLYFD